LISFLEYGGLTHNDAKREAVTGKDIEMMVFYREPGRKSIAGFTGTNRIGRIFSPASAEFSPGHEPPSAPGTNTDLFPPSALRRECADIDGYGAIARRKSGSLR